MPYNVRERSEHWQYYCKDHRDYIHRKIARAFGFLWSFKPPQHIRCDVCGNPEARYVKTVMY